MKQCKGWKMSCDVGDVPEMLENEQGFCFKYNLANDVFMSLPVYHQNNE